MKLRSKKLKRIKGFTMIEILSVILILSIISLIVLAIKTNLDRATRNSYYDSLERTISLAGRDYFSDHLEERPVDTDSASLIEINGRTTTKNLEKKSYLSKVLDIKSKDCPGKVVSYLDVDGEFTYLTCLECGDYQTSDRVCGCEVNTTIDEVTGTEYSTCALDEIPVVSMTVVYVSNGQAYNAFDAYDDTTWTSQNIRITYTTTYQYAQKIRVVDETGTVVTGMSCDTLTGTSTKTCTKDITTTTYGRYKAYVVDDLNRLSSNGAKDFNIKVDKTTPTITMTAYNNIGGVYTTGTSNRNLDLTLDVNPPIAPSGYTYKWYYSTDLTNGTNRVLITQMSVIPIGENIVEVTAPGSGGEEEGDGDDEITDVDTANGVVGYTLDKTDQSLFVNTPRLVTISRKYIIEITTGTGIVTTTSKNATIYRPAAKVTITAKKASGTTLQSGVWSNDSVTLTANISDPVNYSVKRWTKKNVSTGVKTNIQNTSPTYNVTSVSTASGDEYTAVVALSDNTDEEESEGFVIKIDEADPTCGSVSGSSSSWTSSSRTISVKCSDTLSGCSSSSFSKTFSSSTKTSSISIKDKAGNTKSCSVNVYVDKGNPSVSLSQSSCNTSGTCTFSVSASDSYSGVSYKKCKCGGSYYTCSSSMTCKVTSYDACAYSVDKVGNKSSTKCIGS